MVRVPYLDRNDLPEPDRVLFDNLVAERGAGPVGNLYRVLAHIPNLLRRFMSLGNQLRSHTGLDPRLRELEIMAVGMVSGAAYEFTHHWELAMRVGVGRDKLERLADYEHAPLFDDRERAVIRYAVEATRDVRVSEQTFNALSGFLDHPRLLELVVNVAYYNMVVRIIEPLRVDLEPGLESRLRKR